MYIDKWKHENVNVNGEIGTTGGCVIVDGAVRSEANGLFLYVATPRSEEGVVHGVTFRFNDQDEKNKFINNILREMSK